MNTKYRPSSFLIPVQSAKLLFIVIVLFPFSNCINKIKNLQEFSCRVSKHETGNHRSSPRHWIVELKVLKSNRTVKIEDFMEISELGIISLLDQNSKNKCSTSNLDCSVCSSRHVVQGPTLSNSEKT